MHFTLWKPCPGIAEYRFARQYVLAEECINSSTRSELSSVCVHETYQKGYDPKARDPNNCRLIGHPVMLIGCLIIEWELGSIGFSCRSHADIRHSVQKIELHFYIVRSIACHLSRALSLESALTGWIIFRI